MQNHHNRRTRHRGHGQSHRWPGAKNMSYLDSPQHCGSLLQQCHLQARTGSYLCGERERETVREDVSIEDKKVIWVDGNSATVKQGRLRKVIRRGGREVSAAIKNVKAFKRQGKYGGNGAFWKLKGQECCTGRATGPGLETDNWFDTHQSILGLIKLRLYRQTSSMSDIKHL